ncbi:MAG: PhoH family protein [Planctomycetes bacterium]|nr:PhoH family protein [Planctomycetota bacterium]
MRKIIQIPSQNLITAVLGIHDNNIKIIQRLTGAKIYFRNNELQILGSKRSVDKAYTTLMRIITLVSNGASVKNIDIEEILDSSNKPKHTEERDPGSGFRKGVTVKSKTEGQQKYVEEMESNHIVICIGPAGTGKTFLAVCKAIEYIKTGKVRKIILVRPVVEAGERLGFLPGDIEQKINPYLRPLYDSLNYFLEPGILKNFIRDDTIETAPLAYMRGRTLNEAFVILDEAQNTTPSQMKMFLTRFGENSKFIITGDVTQIDLKDPKSSGLIHAKNILGGIVGISIVNLTKNDVVRHPVVQKIVDAYDKKARTF